LTAITEKRFYAGLGCKTVIKTEFELKGNAPVVTSFKKRTDRKKLKKISPM
jgi:hypothetical protein